MQCANHPANTATTRCAGCGRWVCDLCKVQLGWNVVCTLCQNRMGPSTPAAAGPGMSPRGMAPAARRRPHCETATHAFIFAMIGLVCFGAVFGIVAIIKANQAKQEIRRKNLGGEGLATAALVIGIIDIVFWVIGSIFYWILVAAEGGF